MKAYLWFLGSLLDRSAVLLFTSMHNVPLYVIPSIIALAVLLRLKSCTSDLHFVRKNARRNPCFLLPISGLLMTSSVNQAPVDAPTSRVTSLGTENVNNALSITPRRRDGGALMVHDVNCLVDSSGSTSPCLTWGAIRMRGRVLPWMLLTEITFVT